VRGPAQLRMECDGRHLTMDEREFAVNHFWMVRPGTTSDKAAAEETAAMLQTTSWNTVLRAVDAKRCTGQALTQRQQAQRAYVAEPLVVHRRALRIDSAVNQRITDIVAGQGTMTSARIAEEVMLNSCAQVSARHVRRVRLQDNTRKRTSPIKAEACLVAQVDHAQYMAGMCVGGNMAIYVDETHKKPSTGFARYGYSPAGVPLRVELSGPLGESYTTLAAMSSEGMLAWKPTRRDTNSPGQDTFAFLSDFATTIMGLIEPYPSRHSVVVVDRCPCVSTRERADGLCELTVQAAACEVLRLSVCRRLHRDQWGLLAEMVHAMGGILVMLPACEWHLSCRSPSPAPLLCTRRSLCVRACRLPMDERRGGGLCGREPFHQRECSAAMVRAY
jgi:hypothetical protein